MGSFYDTPEWKKGDKGQKMVAWFLAHRGWWVIPSFDYSGPDGDKAPSMFGAGKSLVLPDLDVCRSGERFWVEVKTKDSPTFHVITRTMEHGFNNYHFEDYRSVQRETGNRVFLLFCETQGGRMLGNWLDVLEPHRRVNHSQRMGWMAFFPTSAMKILGWADGMEDLPLFTYKGKPMPWLGGSRDLAKESPRTSAV